MIKNYKKCIALLMVAIIVLAMPLTAYASAATYEPRLVAVRALFDDTDAEIEWNGQYRRATITMNGNTAVFYIGGTTIYVNDIPTISLSQPITLDGGHTYMPHNYAHALLRAMSVEAQPSPEPIFTSERLALVLAILEETDDADILTAIEADRDILDVIINQLALVTVDLLNEEIADIEALMLDPEMAPFISELEWALGWLEGIRVIIEHPAFQQLPREIASYFLITDEYDDEFIVRLIYIGNGFYVLDEDYTIISESIMFMEYLGDGLFFHIGDWL